MALKKKDIPINIHKILQPFINKIGKNIEIETEAGCLIKIIDVDLESDFYFKIISYSFSSFTVEKKPSSKYENGYGRHLVIEDNIGEFLSDWISILETYDATPTYFDDPILKSYEEEYFAEFEISEEEKYKPLENNQILLLDEYLGNLSLKLEKYKTEINKIKIDEIQSEINILQENLTNQNRFEVARKFSTILAKIKNLGTKFLKEFITEGRKQIISKGIKFLIEQGPNIIEEFGKHH